VIIPSYEQSQKHFSINLGKYYWINNHDPMENPTLLAELAQKASDSRFHTKVYQG
jgi:hypothetical protein